MPFLFYPLVGLVSGFGIGLFTGLSSKKVLTTAAVVGVGVYAYSKVKG
jgi:predicted transporter